MRKSTGRKSSWRIKLLLLLILVGASFILLRQPRGQLLSAQAALQEQDPEPTPSPSPTPLPTSTPAFPQDYRTLLYSRTNVYHHWMLTYWAEEIECHIYKTDLSKPSDEDVLGYCGNTVYQMWIDQLVCEETPAREEPCTGLTLHYIDQLDEKLKVSIKLPGPLGYVELVNCPAWGVCEDYPLLTFGGYEPLQNQSIDGVQIFLGDELEVECDVVPCTLKMPLTNADGMEVSFFVTSTYGDISVRKTFYMRNIVYHEQGYLFQLIEDPWRSQIPASAAHWDFFPALETLEIPWMVDVTNPEELATYHDYALLAGKLILRGDVSAADCEDGGLLANEAASACGVEAAKEQVYQVQNSFDAEIINAAQESRVPPRLLKGVIAQESQFWNGWVIEGEYGYGMLTDEGVDMLLNWDIRTFLDLCIPVYGELNCAWGYGTFADYPQAYLRGLALSDVGTENEFELIGRTLAAAAGQAGQIVHNVTRYDPGDLLSYKEMWLISLGIYHGGGGCVGTAIEDAWDEERELSWGIISEYLPGECQTIATYPYMVLRYGE